MSKVIRLSNETENILEMTKKDYIDSLKEDFNAALERKETEACLEIDRLIKLAEKETDSEWILKSIYAFRVLTDLDEKIPFDMIMQV